MVAPSADFMPTILGVFKPLILIVDIILAGAYNHLAILDFIAAIIFIFIAFYKMCVLAIYSEVVSGNRSIWAVYSQFP